MRLDKYLYLQIKYNLSNDKKHLRYMFKIAALFTLILCVLTLNSCISKRTYFQQHNLTNNKIFESIYPNLTPIYHIEKLYGKPNYKQNNIWYYQFSKYNPRYMRNESILIALEFENNTIINKSYKNYTNSFLAEY